MRIRRSKHGYQVFSMPREVEHWDAASWMVMIERIDPEYLVRMARVPERIAPRAIRPNDCFVVNDEGDQWVLGIVDVERVEGSSATLFLPLVRTILADRPELDHTPIAHRLRSDRSLVAFGIDTESRFYGRRAWLAYDAFIEGEVLHPLLGLFWPRVSYYAITVSEGEHGRLDFHTKLPAHSPHVATHVDNDDNGDLTVHYGQSLTLFIPSDLRALQPGAMETDPGVVCWIAYEREDDPPIVIGVLRQTSG